MTALRIALIAAALSAPCAAMAQTTEDEAVVSANRSAPPLKTAAPSAEPAQAASAPLMTQAQTVEWLNRASQGARSNLTAPEDKSHGRTVHGGAGASIGTGGYSSVYAWSEIPVGEHGTMGIAVSQTDFGKNGGYALGYDPYGYGYPYGYGQRDGKARSVALSYRWDAADPDGPETPDGCAPGFRYGSHYVEPLWVSRMHATMRAEDDTCDTGLMVRP